MPSTIEKCKLFRIKHITLLEGETFVRNKLEVAFFEIKCTFFGRKENTIRFITLDLTGSKDTVFVVRKFTTNDERHTSKKKKQTSK